MKKICKDFCHNFFHLQEPLSNHATLLGVAKSRNSTKENKQRWEKQLD